MRRRLRLPGSLRLAPGERIVAMPDLERALLEEVARAAAKSLPVRTGLLRQSIRARPPRRRIYLGDWP